MDNPSPLERYYDVPPRIYTSIISEGRKIFALSDIHADIHSLIIVLEDLAEVIEKITPDPDLSLLDTFLRMDISTDEIEKTYDSNFNYKWKDGCNSYIVIVGDIIDGVKFRSVTESENQVRIRGDRYSDGEYYENEYPQIEIKILKFINELNKTALINNGYIYKLFGNHEIRNINTNNHTGFHFPRDRVKNINYYKNIDRHNIFKRGNIGYELLIEGGCWCLLVINKYIFVHGQLVDDIKFNFNTYHEFNTILNDNNSNSLEFTKRFKSCIDQLDDMYKSPLWKDIYSEDQKINNRLLTNDTTFCENVTTQINNFITNTELPNDLKIIVGHCQQNYSSQYNEVNTTFTNKIKTDIKSDIKTEYEGPAITDRFLDATRNLTNENLIFGITMECPINGTNHHRIMRVDVNTSRSLDSTQVNNVLLNPSPQQDVANSFKDKLKQFYYSRTPTVLSITSDDKITIIKSSMKNTFSKQSRQTLNNIINAYKTQHPDIDIYENKYLKYKKKYLQKKIMLKNNVKK